MIEGLFDISIDTPKLHRRGTLSLKSEGETIMGRLQQGDEIDVTVRGTCKDKEFHFEGSDEFGDLGTVEYKADGSVWSSSIDVTCETSIGKVTMFGTALSTSAGELKSSHEYMMAAASGDFDNNDGTMYSGLYADGG